MSHNFCSDVKEMSSLLEETQSGWVNEEKDTVSYSKWDAMSDDKRKAMVDKLNGGQYGQNLKAFYDEHGKLSDDQLASLDSMSESKEMAKKKFEESRKSLTESKEEIQEDADDRRASELLKMFTKKKSADDVAKNGSKDISIGDVTFDYGNREMSAYDDKTGKLYIWDVNNVSGRGNEFSLMDVIKEASLKRINGLSEEVDLSPEELIETFNGQELSSNDEVLCENAMLQTILCEGASKQALKQYLVTALWSSTDDEGNPLDDEKDVDDIDKSSVKKAQKDLDKFWRMAGDLLDGEDETTVAHDFWLTRNGHGAGFWDGDYEKEKGKALTKLSKKFGEVYAYIGDDGKVYLD